MTANSRSAPKVGKPRATTTTSRSAWLTIGWLLLKKDLVTEFRTKDTLITLLFFGALLVVIFTFSFWTNEQTALSVTPGVLWIALAFTGTLGIDRSFAREQDGNTLTALVLVPGAPRALYVAKTSVNVLFMVLVEALVVPLALLMLSTPIVVADAPLLVLTLFLGTLGFAAVGTVFSAMLVAVKRRGVLLPIVLYPVSIPLLVMGVKATASILEHRPVGETMSWVQLMGAIDVLYVLAGAWLFNTVLEEE